MSVIRVNIIDSPLKIFDQSHRTMVQFHMRYFITVHVSSTCTATTIPAVGRLSPLAPLPPGGTGVEDEEGSHVLVSQARAGQSSSKHLCCMSQESLSLHRLPLHAHLEDRS